MRRHSAFEQALREAAAQGEIFDEIILLRTHKVGRGSVNRFIAAGWIEVIRDNGFCRQLRLTDKGRLGLAALTAQSDAKK